MCTPRSGNVARSVYWPVLRSSSRIEYRAAPSNFNTCSGFEYVSQSKGSSGGVVGTAVGVAVSGNVGTAVGMAVGTAVGMGVGTAVGKGDGLDVGR
jgi:hypothetical protein